MTIRTIVVPALILGMTVAYMYLYPNHDLYGYDEADYAYAAKQGIIANFTDKDAIGIGTFIESGTKLGADKTKRTQLSELIRNSGDISFYRHYHGPFLAYWLNILAAVGLESEASARTACLFLLGLLAGVLYWAGRQEHGLGYPAALLPVVLVFGSEMNVLTASILTPHAVYAITSLAALVMLSRYIRTNRLRDWYVAVVALALAFLSIEYAILVAVTFLVYALWNWKSIQKSETLWRFVGKSLGLFFVTIAVLWIGGIAKLTLVKNYVFFSYFTFVRGSEFGSGSFFDVWGWRLTQSPVVCAFALAALVYALFRIRRHQDLLPYLLYPTLVLLSSFRNTSPSPTYVSSIFPPLFLIAGIASHELLGKRSAIRSSALVLATATGAVFFLHPTRGDTKVRPVEQLTRSVVRTLRALPTADSSLVVPRLMLPTLHYYFPDKQFYGYAANYDDSVVTTEMLLKPNLDGFLYDGDSLRRYTCILNQTYSLAIDTVHVSDDQMYYYCHLKRL